MYRHRILYTILNVAIFSAVLIGARRSGELKFQLVDNSADVGFRRTSSSNNKETQFTKNTNQLNALLSQADLSLLDGFESNFEGSPKKEEDQDKSVLIIDVHDLSLLDFEPDGRMMSYDIQRSDVSAEAIGPAIIFDDSCEIIVDQEQEDFQQQEIETFIQEELNYNEESGEVSITITISEHSSCQTVFQCEPQIHPILGTRCFCRTVLVCETIYG